MARPCVVLGVTGSIAAYKAGDIIRRLQAEGCDVVVVMTPAAEKFVTPLTFEVLSQGPVYRGMFMREGGWDIEHLALARRADVFLIAPATADCIARIAAGMADDLVCCTAVATKAPVILAPAMNTDMFTNPIVQENILKLRQHGVKFIEPKEARLACGTTGSGALADVDVIVRTVVDLLKSSAR